MKRLISGWEGLAGNTRGVAFVILAMASWATMNAATKAMGAYGYDAEALVFLRANIVLLMLLPFVLLTRGRLVMTRQPKLHLVRGVFIATSSYTAAYAVTRLPLAETNALLMTAALFMLPLGVWLLGERAHWSRWLGVGIGFGGVLAILRPGADTFQFASLVALLCALSEALLGVVLKKMGTTEPSATIVWWSYVTNWVVFGLLCGFYLPMPPPESWYLLPLLGLSTMGVYFAYIQAYKVGDASAVEAGSFSLLLFSPLVGWLWFAELPTQAFWAGAGLLVVGIAIVIIEPKGRAA
ncbi:DMT family transporter [Chitinimonas sp. BJYL2]|uniref:DMT family transporter n=1 Tax=Chitinimonas sp. BJYL2 TaxID=2976696 RepID=UPI0022B4ADE3|nr:DMT family transporter [Chitinimonas sp. BJYL2]